MLKRISSTVSLALYHLPLLLVSTIAISIVWRSAFADKVRDETRLNAFYSSHNDYPDYDRPDKTSFLLSFLSFSDQFNTDELVVKFHQNTPYETIETALSSGDPQGLVQEFPFWRWLRGVAPFVHARRSLAGPPDRIDAGRLEAEYFAGHQFPDPLLFYDIQLLDNRAPAELLEAVLSREDVELAYYRMPTSPGVDVLPVTPDLDSISHQAQLDSYPATGGVGAREFWNIPNGTGLGVRVGFIEVSATTNHEDLPPLFAQFGSNDNSDEDADHGAAVMGIVGARSSSPEYGFLGIAPDSTLSLSTTLGGTTPLDAALSPLADVAISRAGDIISVSMQSSGCPPTSEFHFRNLVDQAVARGVIVFVLAGNISTNVDLNCANFQPSGSIIVGGGTPDTNHNYRPGSNFGQSVDLQGWYTKVHTLGDGKTWGCSHDTLGIQFDPGATDMAFFDESDVLSGDCDGDGTDDLVVCDDNGLGACSWSWARNQSTGAPDRNRFSYPAPAVTGLWGNSDWHYYLGQLDGSGGDDVLLLYPPNGSLYWTSNLGAGNCSFNSTYTTVNRSGSTYSQSDRLFLADLNSDGRDDIIVCRPTAGSCQWWYALALPGQPYAVAALQPLFIGGQQIHYSTSEHLMVGDYDLDGRPDIICARGTNERRLDWFYSTGISTSNFGAEQRIILKGQRTFPCCAHVSHLVSGNFDPDGLLDFAHRDAGTDKWQTLTHLGLGDGRLIQNPERQLYMPDFAGTSAATPMVAGVAALIQGIYRADSSSGCDAATMKRLLIQTGVPQGPVQADRHIGPFPNLLEAAKCLFLHGSRLYVRVGQYYSLYSFYSEDLVANGDFNGDGRDDLMMYRPSTDTWRRSLNLGSFYFADEQNVTVDFSLAGAKFITGDLDGDGYDDIVAKIPPYGFWLVCWNDGTGLYFGCTATTVQGSLTRFSMSDDFYLADIDGDGMDDMVVEIATPREWKFCPSNGGAFGTCTALSIAGSTNAYLSTDAIGFADFDGDGFDDLIARRPGVPQQWFLSFNTKSNTLRTEVNAVIDGSNAAYYDTDRFAFGDYTGDGTADIVARRPSARTWYRSAHVVMP